ncbi:nitrate/nitrite transporter [uncultured Shewanella sp.]|uniref:MFS transporter n=1 Tax=uncultured Shewanella sp. TaxID=173975 RepID=UPI0026108397|nr:nitrate/nitrite transporter [uncultured Shewanella sp.]
MISDNMKKGQVLASSTAAFTICFMIWIMFAVLGIPIKEMLSLNETQFGLLAATPILTGSLTRLPLGVLGDRFGGRIVLLLLMLSTTVPIYLISYATEYWQFLLLGLFVGLAGGSFSVGIAYVAKWFDKQHQGFAMGVFGAGNAGAALTKFVAPVIIVSLGWQMVPKIYAGIMLIMAVLFWLFSFDNPKHKINSNTSLKQQLQVLKDPQIWRYCQYYSFVFGGYVALALWMTKYYIGEYGFDLKTAAIFAAAFSLPGGVLRALGGWLSDKYGAHCITWWVMWVCWICLFIMSYPETEFIIKTVQGPKTFNIHLNASIFTALLFTMGVAMAFGKASVYKYISEAYPDNMGTVSGIVGLAGGLGGFVLPIMFGALLDLTQIRTSAFMLMYAITCVSLLLMYFTEIKRAHIISS